MAHDIVDDVSDGVRVMGQGDTRGGDVPQRTYTALDLITLEQAVLLAY